MSFQVATNQVTVDTTVGGVIIVPARASRHFVTLVNLGTTDVYVGVGTVSTSNGYLLLGSKGAAITIASVLAIKAIVAAGTQAVAFLEEFE